MANNIVFAAITGNEARALALIEKHVAWLAHDGLNVDAHFAALTAFAVALDRVTAAGHGDTPVRGADAPALVPLLGAHDGPWSAADLAAAAWSTAERIGAQFDERDGTDGHARSLARMRALADERYDVPIRSDAFVAPTPATTPADPEAWYERAMQLAQFGAEQETLAALPHALEVDDPAQRAQLLSMHLGILVALDRVDEAERLLPERIAALRAAGNDAQADLEERLKLATFGLHTDETMAALEEELAAADRLPAWSRGDLAISRASLHLRAEEPDAALDLAELAARSFAEAEDTRLSNTTTLVAIGAVLSKGDLDAGRTLLDRFLAQDDLSAGHRAHALQTRARLRAARARTRMGRRTPTRCAGCSPSSAPRGLSPTPMCSRARSGRTQRSPRRPSPATVWLLGCRMTAIAPAWTSGWPGRCSARETPRRPRSSSATCSSARRTPRRPPAPVP